MKRTVIRAVHRLSENEMVELSRCTYRGRGTMQWQLNTLWNRKDKTARATIVREDDGTLVGWALTWERDGEHWANFFVPPPFRRRGIGRKLADSVIRRYEVVNVSAWNRTSERFFENWAGLMG